MSEQARVRPRGRRWALEMEGEGTRECYASRDLAKRHAREVLRARGGGTMLVYSEGGAVRGAEHVPGAGNGMRRKG